MIRGIQTDPILCNDSCMAAQGMSFNTTASATSIVIPDLFGYGDDFFNNHYYMQVIKAGGAAPEGEVRLITDYDSATGTFTTDAFTATIESGDELLITHESTMAIGRNDADNGYSSSSVVGNRDGSLLERTEFIIGMITGGAADLRVSQSIASGVEVGGLLQFTIGLMDVDSGAIASANINITGITQTMERSRSGGAWSAVTAPVFAKMDGQVYCSYEFLAAEWQNDDMYRMTLSGITVTIGTQTAHVPAYVWSNKVSDDIDITTKLVSIENKVDTIDTVVDNVYIDTQAISTIVSAIQSTDLPAVASAVTEIQVDLGNPSIRTNLQTIEAMLGNPDTADKTIYEAVKNIRETAINGSSLPVTNTLSDILHKDGSYTYDNTTDSLEAISDAIVSGSYSVVADSGTTTTVVDATYTQANDYWNGTLLVCVSGTNAGQARPVVDFANATGTFTVYPAFNGAVVATDTFLLISGWKFAEWIAIPDVPITDTVTTTESDAVLLELATAGQSYRVNSVRLKFADPGANTVTVKLYELINDVSTEVDSFTVTTDNYSSYYGLVDMFGTSHLAGDNLKISAVMDAGTCAVTGQYSYEKSYTA